MKPSILFEVIIILFHLHKSFEQALPESNPERTTVCRSEILRGSCQDGEIIEVGTIQYGTKLIATCAESNVSAECCEYDKDDCFVKYDDNQLADACSGRKICDEKQMGPGDTSSCDVAYSRVNHYLTMEYYCVPETNVFRLDSQETVVKTVTGPALYLLNTDYPNPVRDSESGFNCSVETISCSSKINVYLIHFKLDDGDGTCEEIQRLEINDNGDTQILTCANNTDYAITLQMTSRSNYITVTFTNSGGSNDGYVWIGFKATETAASLKIECPAMVQTFCIDCSNLASPIYGMVFSAGLAFSSQAIYSCNRGFDLVGNVIRTCQASGTWSGVEPICQAVECPPLASPDNGNVSLPGGRTYSQQAIYTCYHGFALNGSTTSTCQANQTWSNPRPSCYISCSQEAGADLSPLAIAGIAALGLSLVVLALSVAVSVKCCECEKIKQKNPDGPNRQSVDNKGVSMTDYD